MGRDNNVLQIVINGTNNAGPMMKNVGQQMVKLGTISAAAFTAAAVRAGQFEKGLAEISTLLDGDVAPAIDRMRGELLGLSVQFGQTIGNLTKARYDIVSAGFTDAADSARILTQANKLAVAGVSDVATAADILTTAINGLGLTANEATQVSDVLFQTVRKGKTTLTELAGAFGPVFATARVANVSLDELGATMATLTAAGIDTREAATALNNLMRSLAAPTGAAKAKLEEMGITLDQGLLPAMEALGEVSGEGLDALAELIPNIRALKAAATAASDVEKLDENLRAMAESAGVTETAFGAMQETFDFQTKQLRSGLDALIIQVGTQLLPTFRDWVNRANGVIEVIRENKDAVFELVAQLFDMTGRVLKVGFALLALQKVFVIVRKAMALMNKQTLIVVSSMIVLIGIMEGADWLLEKMGIDFNLVEKASQGLDSAIAKLTEDFPILKELLDAVSSGMQDMADEADEVEGRLRELGEGKPPGLVVDLPQHIKDAIDALEDFRNQIADLAEFTREDFAQMAFALGDNVGGAISEVASGMLGLTENSMSLGDAFKSVAASIIADVVRIMARILVARLLVKRFGAELRAMQGGGAGGGGVGGTAGMVIGTAIGGPVGGAIGGALGGLFGSRGGRVRNAALGARIPGMSFGSGVIMPGTAGLDRTLVAASGGEVFTPAATANHAERMLKKTLTSPRRARRRSGGGKLTLDIQANRPFRRDEQILLTDSVTESFDRSGRHNV